MQFTGNLLTLKRSFYPQTGNYGFSIDCVVDNTTGQYLFGLSGNGNTIEFKLESGKVYFENKFVHSYRSNQEFSISTDLTNVRANVSKDETPLLYNFGKPTGFFDTFYFKRSDAAIGATFSLNVSGNNIPSYIISQNGYLVSSGQAAVTGRFTNNSFFPIRIFDSAIQSSQPYLFKKLDNYVNGFSTGMFAYSGDFDSIDFSQPVFTTFDTNFGDSTVLFTITDLRARDGFVLLEDIDDFSFASGTALNRDVNYTNYSGGIQTNGFNTQLSFVLEYISGSGVFGGYNKSFTGAWNMMTGINSSFLYSMPVSINSTGTRMIGSGTYAPNSFVNFQLNHMNSGTNADAATLTISGQLVYNPISTTINVQNY